MSRTNPILLALLLVAIGSPFGSGSAAGQTPAEPKEKLADPRRTFDPATITIESAGQFTINLFTMLNWPADSKSRGVPDWSRKVGDPTATVWESYKNTSEIYRADGAKPPAWSVVCEFPDPPPTLEELGRRLGPVDSTWIHFLSEQRMIDGQQVVDAQARPLQYNVRCNQPYFDYVTANPAGHELYCVEGQQAARGDETFRFDFPRDTIEIKSSWTVLAKEDDPATYWTAYAGVRQSNGEIGYVRVGLTGLHVISKVIPNWFWATFEHDDVPTTVYRYFLGDKGQPLGMNPTFHPETAPFNQLLRKRLAGTKWANYRLVGWQHDATDSQGQPDLLANMTMETYFPATSSCITCHAQANIGPPENRRLTMWDETSNGIWGLVGDVDFDSRARLLYPNQSFKTMDHVWSLRQAKSRAGVKP